MNKNKIINITRLFSLLSLIWLILCPISLSGQNEGYMRKIPTSVFLQPTQLLEYDFDSLNSRKPIWLPFVETVGINIGVSSFNRYVLNEDFAVINMGTISDNFKTGFTWDADQFITNQIGHPYQGSLYYNFTRSAGYDYWTSLGVTAFGSLQWEFFMENEPASINDFISTSLSGAALGEMLYRASSLIIDENATGFNRFWREAAAFAVAPTRGLNRLFSGRSQRHTENKTEKSFLFGSVGLGMNNVADGTDFTLGEKNLMGTIEFTYGSLFDKSKPKPFDVFKIDAGFNFYNQPSVGYVSLYGLLFGRRLRVQEDQNILIGLFQHYDYYDNAIYQVSSTSIGAGMLYQFPRVSKAEVISSLHLSGIVMGAANSDYALKYGVANLDSARTYNFGIGLDGKFETTIQIERFRLYMGYYLFWIHTLQGAPGDEFVGILKPKLRFYFTKRLSANLEYLLYHRMGVYEGYPNISMQNNEQRLSIAYHF